MPPKNNPDRDIRSQLNRDSSLTLGDARLLPATGSAVDMLPDDVREDMENDTPQAPQTEFSLGTSARTKMNKALCIYGTDGRSTPTPSLVEDAMIASIDGSNEEDLEW